MKNTTRAALICILLSSLGLAGDLVHCGATSTWVAHAEQSSDWTANVRLYLVGDRIFDELSLYSSRLGMLSDEQTSAAGRAAILRIISRLDNSVATNIQTFETSVPKSSKYSVDFNELNLVAKSGLALCREAKKASEDVAAGSPETFRARRGRPKGMADCLANLRKSLVADGDAIAAGSRNDRLKTLIKFAFLLDDISLDLAQSIQALGRADEIKAVKLKLKVDEKNLEKYAKESPEIQTQVGASLGAFKLCQAAAGRLKETDPTGRAESPDLEMQRLRELVHAREGFDLTRVQFRVYLLKAL